MQSSPTYAESESTGSGIKYCCYVNLCYVMKLILHFSVKPTYAKTVLNCRWNWVNPLYVVLNSCVS